MRLQPVPDPEESYSLWDQGWRFAIAMASSGMIVLIGLLHLALALEVIECIL